MSSEKMNFSKSLNIKLLFVLLFSIIINCNENDYELDYKEDIENGDNFKQSLSMNDTIDDNVDSDYDNEYEEECTVDSLIDQYLVLLLPDDYSEAKKLYFTKKLFSNYETIVKVKRLKQYQQNITQKLEPIIRRMIPQLLEMFCGNDDSLPDCMASIDRIAQAAKNGEHWSFKCEFYFKLIREKINLIDYKN